MKPRGFWSYVHKDDEAESGRIVALAHDIVGQYRLLTGQSVDLFFLDKDDILWGDAWREAIDGSLATVAFFVPVLTPSYFQSAECRRELQAFSRRAKDLGVRELVLPLLYVDVPELRQDTPRDDLVALVKDFQWRDWTDLGLEDRTSSAYRRAVRELAQRLVAANDKADDIDVAAKLEAAPDGDADGDDEDGIIDKLATFEEAIPEWSETLHRIGAEVEQIGRLMQAGTDDLNKADKQGRGFAGRLTVARRLASELQPHSDSIQESSQAFTSQLHSVDQGVRIIIEEGPRQAVANEDRDALCEFFDSVRFFASSSRDALAAAKKMTEAIEPIEKMSRDLRRPLRTMRHALTVMVEGQEVIDEWESLIEEAPLDCPGERL